MLKYRTQKPIDDPGILITQPNQAFTVRQIIDQFARGELIPTRYSPTDSLGDEIDDDDVDDVIEFEDSLDAEAHLKMNEYQLYKNESLSNSQQEGTSEARESTDTSSKEATN